MRIAIIIDLPSWYADTMYLNEVEKRLSKTGIMCKVFVVSGSKFFKKIDNTTGLMRLLKINGLLKKLSEFDIIHVQFAFPLALGLAIFKSLGVLKKPLIVHTHGVDVFTVPNVNYGLRRKYIGRIFANYVWKKADRIIAVCEKAKREIEKAGINGDKIDILYNGVDESLFSKTEVKEELSSLRKDNDIIFLSVASMVPVKNHVGLLKSFEKIVEKYGSKYRLKLILIGEKTASSHPIIENNHVLHLGKKNHADLKYIYSISDVFVLPSLSEAHPWALLEAMSCEMPVIASDVGGIPETLADSRFLVNPYDSTDLQKKLEYMIEMNSAEREKIGRTNRQRVLDYYTIDKHIENLKKIYERTSQV